MQGDRRRELGEINTINTQRERERERETERERERERGGRVYHILIADIYM